MENKNFFFLKDNNILIQNFILYSEEKNELFIEVFCFLKYIFCKNKCKYDDCNDCRKIKNNKIYDIKYVGDFFSTIKKSKILNIIEDSNYSALEKNNKKVYIVQGIENATISAQSSLLTWLENSFTHICIILLSRNKKNILDTIKSRLPYFDIKTKKTNNYLFSNLEKKFLNLLIKNKIETLMYFIDDFFVYEVDDFIKFIQNAIFYLKNKNLEKVINYLLFEKMLENINFYKKNILKDKKLFIEKFFVDIYEIQKKRINKW